MILQTIAWPDRPDVRELYYRCDAAVGPDAPDRAVRLGREAIRFDTYFNAFSIGKWRKYTRLGGVALALELSGEAEITLCRHDLRGDRSIRAVPDRLFLSEMKACLEGLRLETQALTVERFACDGFQPVTLAFPDCDGADAISFTVRPLSEGAAIRAAAYVSAGDTPEPQAVNLALAICTYRREKDVAANLEMLRREVFERPDSPLYGHVQVYIADNGQTLEPDRFAGMPVRVFPNLNSGGSGGFSRAAIEAVNDAAYPATHVILMDDDIAFGAGALERNRSFLSLIRPEYALNLLGGAMLNGDHRHLIYASGERFTLDGIKNVKSEWDLRDLKYALVCEIDIPINYYGWWYCCIPVPLLRQKQYSMPLFVQFDDIEFSLRCRETPKIDLNGVCCWHNPLEHKETDARFYYNYRNFNILDLLYYPGEFSGKTLKTILWKDCVNALFTYSFRRAHLMMRGAEDFLKGPDWLVAQDPAALNRSVIDASDRIVPAAQSPVPFDLAAVLRSEDFSQTAAQRLFRRLTLNGWLLPARKAPVAVELWRPPMQYFFRAGTVVKHDPETGRTVIARRSWREALRLLRHLLRTLKAIDRQYDRAAAEYRAKHDAITSEAFWRKFLGF